MRNNFRKNITNTLFLLGAIFFLMIPAIRNGYPMLYSDSASYIVSGHERVVPIDRPVVYGFLIRHISLSFSLWFVVFVQALIAVGLTWFSYKTIGVKNKIAYTFITCALLGLFSGASNYISQIMPDIFSAFLIWSVALLLITDQSKYSWMLWGLALVSTLVHFSNLLTITILATTLVIFVFILRKKQKQSSKRIIQLLGLIVLPWVLLPIINYSFQKEFFINKSSNIFFTGRLIETGLLNEYFSAYPEASQYSLFAYKDNLPEKTWQFAWNGDSPLYEGDCMKEGWGTCWIEKSDEYGRMIRSVLSKPVLLKHFIKISFKDWQKQIFDFDSGPLTQQNENSAFNEIITRYFDDASMFKKSGQFNGDLWFTTESTIQRYFVIVAVLIIAALNLFYREIRSDRKLLTALVVIVFGLLINALVCSVFSGVLNRYQGRIIWLIPMLSFLYLAGCIQILKIKKFSYSGKYNL